MIFTDLRRLNWKAVSESSESRSEESRWLSSRVGWSDPDPSSISAVFSTVFSTVSPFEISVRLSVEKAEVLRESISSLQGWERNLGKNQSRMV